MADNTEQFDKENVPAFSDEAIRRFLFGSLSAAEQTAFEERLFTDGTFETQVRRAECELTDDYAFERLSPAERELFEQRFLVSTGRQQKLSLSKALRDHFATEVTQTVSSRTPPVRTVTSSRDMTIGERLQRLLGPKQPSWRLAFGLVILSLLAGTIWMVVRRPALRQQLITQGQKLIPKRRPARQTVPLTNQEESHHPVKALPTPLPEETPSPAPAARVIVESVVLAPQNAYDRDQIRNVRLPEVAPDVLRLQLTPVTNQSGTYRAELLTISGQSVVAEQSFQSSSASDPVVFEIPFRVLRAGDYQVKLSRITGEIQEGVATYYFRVQ
jgi:hypothetical protein